MTQRLKPDFKTIAIFRRDNGRAIRNACRQFVVLCRQQARSVLAVHRGHRQQQVRDGEQSPPHPWYLKLNLVSVHFAIIALARPRYPSARFRRCGRATTDAEVQKVDKEQGKVWLRHGPIANLDMTGMTTVSKIADTRMLDTLKEGNKVKFAADRDFDGVVVVRRSTVCGCPVRGTGGRTILIKRGRRPRE